jgi:hypothetical protein
MSIGGRSTEKETRLMAFKYRGEDRKVEDVVRRSKQSGGSYDSFLLPDIPFFKPREGENTVRIMPPTWEDTKKWGDNWEIQVYLHRNVGPDEGTYLCLDKCLGEKCPVCEARRDADPDEADALKPQWRGLCWVIDRDNEKAGPQVWSMPVSLFREINARGVDKKTNAIILLDHPEDGYDLMFTRTGEKKRTKYEGVEVDRDPTPLHDDEKKQARWIKYIEDNPLPEILNFYEPDYIEKVLFGQVEKRRKRDDDDAEEEEKPARRGRGRREEPDEEEEKPRRGRGRTEPEEDAEEEAPKRSRRGRTEPEEDVEEEEAKPSRRRGRSEPEEEDAKPARRRGRAEPEEDAEEEVDEKPARRRGRSESEEDTEEEEAPSSQAKRQLGRLKGRAR